MAEQRSKRRLKGRSPDEAASSQRPPPLQTKAGNQAVTGMIQRLRATEDEPDSGPVPWEHPTFERQADDIAAKAKGTAGTKDRRGSLSGAPLAESDAAKLTSLTGKDVGKVRLHTDGSSASTAASMGAHAYTSGTDIHFGKGEYDPSSPKGFELLAHEVTHAVQHPAAHDHSGNELVHAKLKGTKKALEDLGGKAKKSLLKSLKGSRWNELLSQLSTYEKYEDQYAGLLADPTSKGFDKAEAKLRDKLLKALLSLEKVALQWQAANDQEGADEIKAHSDSDVDGDHERDVRYKAERRQAVALFLNRARHERTQIERGQFATPAAFDDSTLAWGKDDAVGGGMNRLDEVAYTSADGEIFEGYFKEDKGFMAAMAGHDKDVGIGQHDANYTGRSIAMYRLDKLLQGGVIARTEFAVHTSRNRKEAKRTPGESNLTEATTKIGFVTEKAEGESMSDIVASGGFTMSGDGREGEAAPLSADDPVLQSCMNKLAILDAIAGQLDRHAGNYFVQRDPETGKALGITGIDNDMSFGAKMQTTDSPQTAKNYLAMPELVDEEFGRRLLQISDQDIRDTLAGLLAESEIEATVSRFNLVKDVVSNLEETGQLTSEWGTETRDRQFAASTKFNGGGQWGEDKSMLAREANSALGVARAAARTALAKARVHLNDVSKFEVAIQGLVSSGTLDTDEVSELVDRILADLEAYVDKRGERDYPELGQEWVDTYVEGAVRRL